MDQDRFLDVIYACAVGDGSVPAMLAAFASRYRCIAGVLLYEDQDRPRARLLTVHGAITEEAILLYQTRYAQYDPAPAVMARLAIGEAAATGRLFAAVPMSPFLRELYYPLGHRETMGGPVAKDGRRFGILSVVRGDDREPFTDDEIADFGGLIAHVARALALRRAFFEIEAANRVLQGAVDTLSTALAVLDRSGTILRANLQVRDVLARNDGMSLNSRGRIIIEDGPASRKFAQALDELGTGAPPRIVRVPRAGSAQAYVMKLKVHGTEPEYPIALTIFDPAEPAGDATSVLVEAMEISRPVARLVAALVDGERLEAYAKGAGISVNTAKFHLKTAFQATGTRRQADLVRLVTSLIKDLGR